VLCVGYDTSTCQPLLPKYISMVDSGNLAGHLLVVKQYCLERLKVGLVPGNGRDGLIDTLVQLAREISRVKSVSNTAGGVTIQHLQDTVTAAMDGVKNGRAASLAEWEDLLLSLLSHLRDAEDVLNALCLDPTAAEKLSDCSRWMALSLTQVTEMQNDLPLLQSAEGQKAWLDRKAKVAQHCEDLFHAMDFKFLFDSQRKLFCIGFAVADNRLDGYHYESHKHTTTQRMNTQAWPHSAAPSLTPSSSPLCHCVLVLRLCVVCCAVQYVGV
jgi:cyclic beta-1,2-glucan synthetase